jgi:membrane protease YdiL (CAAX protease family)
MSDGPLLPPPPGPRYDQAPPPPPPRYDQAPPPTAWVPVPPDYAAPTGPSAPVESSTPPASGPAPVRFNGWPGVPLTSVTWGWRAALGLAFLAIAMNWAVSVVANLPAVGAITKTAITRLPASERTAGVWLSLLALSLVTYAVLLAAALIGVKLKGAKLAPAVGLRRGRLWPVVGLVTAGVWIGFAVNIAYSITTYALKVKVPDTNAKLLSASVKSPIGLIAVFLLLAVIAPVAEEILFRGVVFSGLRDSWGEGWAILVSSVLFGVIHLQPLVMIPTAILGLLLAKVFSVTRSLWASIALHSAYNATIMLFGILVLRATGKL